MGDCGIEVSASAPSTVSRQYAIGLTNRRIASQIDALDRAFAEITGGRGSGVFLCACGRASCHSALLTVPLAIHERVRESSHQFIVLPGHGVAGIGEVVQRGDGFEIVQVKRAHRQTISPLSPCEDDTTLRGASTAGAAERRFGA